MIAIDWGQDAFDLLPTRLPGDRYFFAVEGEGADAVDWANPGEALNAFTNDPSATFQSFTSPFQLPEASREPSELKAMA